MREEQYIHIDEEGNKSYFADREMKILHRTDGPAMEWANGTKEWYLDDELHRVDGPAVEWADGTKEWYVNGAQYTEEEFENITKQQPVELTLDQIAANFGVDVKNLKIVK